MKRAPVGLIALGLLLLALVATAIGLVVAGGSYSPAPAGLPEPGPLVGWGAPATRLLTDLLGIATVGWLLASCVLDPSGKDGVVSRLGRADAKRASYLAAAWAVVALIQMVFQVASILGLPLSEAMQPQVIATYAYEIPATRALIFLAVLALVVSAGAMATSTTGAALSWLVVALIAAALPSLGGHSSGLGDHALATSAGVTHVVAATLWIGGLAALAVHAVRGVTPLKRAASRFSPIALTCIVLVAFSGLANGYTRLDRPGQLLSTGYGQVLIAKFLLVLGLVAIGLVMRQRVVASLDRAGRAAAFARVAGIELVIMAMALGLGVALASSPMPRVLVELPSLGESLLGFAYPPPPTPVTVGLGFRLDALFLVGSLVAAGLYLAGAIRLHRRGDHWPVLRTASWLLGLIVVVWCTNAGIATYAQVSVGLHMFQHMMLTMLAPIFLVMGAPATLALRALKPAVGNERGPREWVVWFLHSWITRVLTNPFYVFFVYVIGLYGLYLTPLFGWLMGSHVGHVVMQLHFILSGYVFYWVLIGIDPRPRPLPYWGRFVLLLLALSVHGFFAVALMMGTTPLAAEWYSLVQPPWVTDSLQDSLNGGQVAWALSEIPSLIVLIAIAVQWSRSDEREADRSDRQADRDDDAELRAYNENLSRLARQGQHQGE